MVLGTNFELIWWLLNEIVRFGGVSNGGEKIYWKNLIAGKRRGTPYYRVPILLVTP